MKSANYKEAVSKHLFCHGLFLYCRLYLPYKPLSVFIFLVENVVQKVRLRQAIGFSRKKRNARKLAYEACFRAYFCKLKAMANRPKSILTLS